MFAYKKAVHLFRFINFLFTNDFVFAKINKPVVDMAKLVNAPDCGSGTREFKSRYPPQLKNSVILRNDFFISSFNGKKIP